MNDPLGFGLHWDRDYSVDIARISRLVYLPIVIFVVHPAVIFVVLKKSSMNVDYKVGYICHTILMMIFDIYNCFLYQMYCLAPFPIIICTGLLCDNESDPARLLVILTVCTAALGLPFMFLVLRMHQCALYSENPFKISARTQAIALLLISLPLISNVVGTYLWAVDIPSKWEMLNKTDIAWAKKYTNNFLVLGEDVGDVGPFKNELYIIIFTILTNFSFYILITYHAIYKLQQHSSLLKTPTHQAQLRLIYSLTMQVHVISGIDTFPDLQILLDIALILSHQAISTTIFFISPLVLLFFGLSGERSHWESHPTCAAVFRLLFLMLFSLSPLSNSLIFLARDPWCRKVIQRRRSSVLSLSTPMILPTSDLELIAAKNRQPKRLSLP